MNECITLTTTTDYSYERINDLITSALEGGSNYWYTIVDHNRTIVGAEFVCGTPFKSGGYIDFIAPEYHETKVFRLDIDAIKSGLELFRSESSKSYADWVSENDDANTGDIFLQYCLFSSVIFG